LALEDANGAGHDVTFEGYGKDSDYRPKHVQCKSHRKIKQNGSNIWTNADYQLSNQNIDFP
jgi:hypothetical protein